MPTQVSCNREGSRAKQQWKHAYRRFRVRRGAGVERMSQRDLLRKLRAYGEPLKPGPLRRFAIAFTDKLTVVIALPGRIRWRKK